MHSWPQLASIRITFASSGPWVRVPSSPLTLSLLQRCPWKMGTPDLRSLTEAMVVVRTYGQDPLIWQRSDAGSVQIDPSRRVSPTESGTSGQGRPRGLLRRADGSLILHVFDESRLAARCGRFVMADLPVLTAASVPVAGLGYCSHGHYATLLVLSIAHCSGHCGERHRWRGSMMRPPDIESFRTRGSSPT